MLFIWSQKLFSSSRYSDFCNSFLSFHIFQTQRVNVTGIIAISWIGLHKLANVVFGKTQKTPWTIKNQNCPGDRSIKE